MDGGIVIVFDVVVEELVVLGEVYGVDGWGGGEDWVGGDVDVYFG